MRISIIGLPGSGKSILARALAAKLDIPRLEIDRLWFAAGGHKIPPGPGMEREKAHAYIREKVESFVANENWVSDGLYSRTQPIIAERADRIIYLDIPLWRRIQNHFARVFRGTHRHPEIPFWQDFWFFGELIYRTYKTGPKLRKLVARYHDKITVLRTYKEVNQYLKELSTGSL